MTTIKPETVQEHKSRTGNKYERPLICAAGNIRKELKAHFPGIKFSVKTERFSGGDSISVSWIDGPTSKEVEAIVNKYTAGSFNGYEDIYEYRRGDDRNFNQNYGDAKYISCNRSYSVEFLQSVIETMVNEYHCESPKISNDGSGAWIIDSQKMATLGSTDLYWTISSVARRIASKTSAM